MGDTATFEPKAPAGEVGAAALRAQFAKFLLYGPGVKEGRDPEEVHQMRVAARRMRAALREFHGCFPDSSQGLREELKWLSGLLGAVRDLDVVAEGLRASCLAEDDDAAAPILEALSVRKAGARVVLLEALDSKRYASLKGSLEDLLSGSRRGGHYDVPACAVASLSLRRRRKAAKKLAASISAESSPDEFHRLRILCKRLRYSAEFFAAVYGDPAKAYATGLVPLQDLLGRLQDLRMARGVYEAILESPESPLSPQSTRLLGNLVGAGEEDAIALRKEFSNRTDSLGGKAWKKLERRLASKKKARERSSKLTSDEGAGSGQV
jgi:triphosphatase